MGGRSARPSGQFLILARENSPLRSLTRHFAASVSISTRMTIAAMSNKNMDCRD
jgi:hypothetical protein